MGEEEKRRTKRGQIRARTEPYSPADEYGSDEKAMTNIATKDSLLCKTSLCPPKNRGKQPPR